MKLEAVIFDLDGVICHTDEYHYLAWKALADREGIPFDRKVNDRLRGVSRMASLTIILERATRSYSEEERQEMARLKNERYRASLLGMSPEDLSPDVKRTLDVLRERGYKLVIGSSSRNAPLILERIGLGDFFDAVSDGNQIRHSKPDPEVFLLAAKLVAIAPEHCMVVEDAESGIAAAQSGGFASAAIGAAAKDGAQPEADYRLDKLSDLLAIL